uniref:Ubiquitin-activating enzyme E1 C-terminal domain-containing protein n=1 Tax=Araucaria cunninghamii TaxID=56994 RepID=A0A0D6R658_ARACU
MCLEVYKILQDKPLEEYRHSYFNLALPFFTSASPIKAVENKVIRSEMEPLVWTLWDKFELDCVEMSLQSFLAEFKRQHGLEVNMIMFGKSLLYAEFLNKKKMQERMSLTLLDLVLIVGKVTIPISENKLILSLTCTDADDLDVEVPDIIVRVR